MDVAQLGRNDYSRSCEQVFLQKLQAWYSPDCDLSAPVVPMLQQHEILFPPLKESVEYGSYTPLFYAVHMGWTLVVDWLLAHGARVDDLSGRRPRWPRDNGFLRAPLFAAVMKDNEFLAKRLLDAGAQVDACSDTGEPSLALACRHGPIKICKLLLSRGADPHLRDEVNFLSNTSELLEIVCASGGWKSYVDAPRKELFKFRKALPTLQRGPSSVPAHVERLFADAGVPDEVFRHVLAFWRSARDY